MPPQGFACHPCIKPIYPNNVHQESSIVFSFVVGVPNLQPFKLFLSINLQRAKVIGFL